MKLHSVVGLITNSSSVVYSYSNEDDNAYISFLRKMEKFFGQDLFSMENIYIRKEFTSEYLELVMNSIDNEDWKLIVNFSLQNEHTARKYPISYKDVEIFNKFFDENPELKDKYSDLDVMDYDYPDKPKFRYIIVNKLNGEELNMFDIMNNLFDHEGFYDG